MSGYDVDFGTSYPKIVVGQKTINIDSIQPVRVAPEKISNYYRDVNGRLIEQFFGYVYKIYIDYAYVDKAGYKELISIYNRHSVVKFYPHRDHEDLWFYAILSKSPEYSYVRGKMRGYEFKLELESVYRYRNIYTEKPKSVFRAKGGTEKSVYRSNGYERQYDEDAFYVSMHKLVLMELERTPGVEIITK